MSEQNETAEFKKKIILPKKLQTEMLEFFLKTSIPRMKKLREEQEKNRLLSEKNSDRSGENGIENSNLCES